MVVASILTSRGDNGHFHFFTLRERFIQYAFLPLPTTHGIYAENAVVLPERGSLFFLILRKSKNRHFGSRINRILNQV